MFTLGPKLDIITEGANAVNWNRPTVFAANHISAMDIPLLYAGLPTSFRIVAKKELFRLPFLGWHLRRSGQIAVDASNARASFRSLHRAVAAIQHGHPVVIFPEGGRSPSGELLPFRSGPFYLAIKAQVPVTPIAIIGTYEMLPMNTYHVMPRPLKLVVGAPIPIDGYTLRDLDKLGAKVEAAIRELYQRNLGGSASPPT
ncbi:MAG: lysophospholipid acyltransferase family protein [Acidobacteriaceae bacterium]